MQPSAPGIHNAKANVCTVYEQYSLCCMCGISASDAGRFSTVYEEIRCLPICLHGAFGNSLLLRSTPTTGIRAFLTTGIGKTAQL
jgi:hypothetical protein